MRPLSLIVQPVPRHEMADTGVTYFIDVSLIDVFAPSLLDGSVLSSEASIQSRACGE
jgi:hypothetical protein